MRVEEIVVYNRIKQWYLHLLYLLAMFPLNYFDPKRGPKIALAFSAVVALFLISELLIITKMPAIVLSGRELRIRRFFYYKTYPRSEVVQLEYLPDDQFRFTLLNGKTHKIDRVWFHPEDLSNLYGVLRRRSAENVKHDAESHF